MTCTSVGTKLRLVGGHLGIGLNEISVNFGPR